MDKDMFNLFITIGMCHRLLKDHADELASRSGVRTVKHWSDMSNVDDAFRLEEYVDAELTSGQGISWCLELTLSGDGIMVEADVRRIHGKGQDVLVTIADCEFQNAVEGSNGVAEITRKLCASNPV